MRRIASPPPRRWRLRSPAPRWRSRTASRTGSGHPEVGALLAQHAFSDETWEECTGTLISPTVFLTAEHCDEGVSRVAVTFDSMYDSKTGKTYWGTWHGDPAYNQAQSDPHDIAVVVLDKAVKAHRPGAATGRGLSSRRSRATSSSRPSATARRRSRWAPEARRSLRRRPLRGSRHAQLDQRELASDLAEPVDRQRRHVLRRSGGPNFLGAGSTETNIVAATTITGDSVCRSTNVDYRLDTPSARGFAHMYVPGP